MADWAIHIFREHNKKADSWAAKGVKGREEKQVDTVNVCVVSGTVAAKVARVVLGK